MSNKNPFDALNRNREAYHRGVETNHRLRQAANDARAMAAMKQAQQAYEREWHARPLAAAGNRERQASRQVAANDQRWIDTYSIYLDSVSTGEEVGGEEILDVEFRVVPRSADSGNPDRDAVIAGLDLVDLINLRDALNLEIDDYALSAMESQLRDL